MAQALEAGTHFTRVSHHEDGAAIGSVALPLPGGASAMAWSRDRTRCLVLDGELYDTGELERSFGTGPDAPSSQADLVLRLFERCGDRALARLNGSFAAAVWDSGERRLSLFNDRLGLCPLYWARVGDGVVFGSGVRAVLADARVPRTVDLVGLNQFLVYDHLLDDRTLVESVRLLPQASVLTFREGESSIRRYWTLRYPEIYERRQEEEYVEGFMHHLRRAVLRQKPDGRPAAVLLSGGLDSRFLAGLLCEQGDRVPTLTFGIPRCDDARVAAEVARSLHAPHRFCELKPDWLLHHADEAVRITDGLGNIVNLHVLANIEAQSRQAQVLYKGFLGDALFGFALKRQMWADYAPADDVLVHRDVHRSQGVLNYERDEQARLLTDGVERRVGDAVLETYRDGMRRAGVAQLANQRLYFDLTQRVPRMTLNGVQVARGRTVVRLPFADNDLLEFALTVPPGFMFERYLPRVAFARHFPELAGIPVAGTGRPMRSCARDLVAQAKSLAAWHLRRRGLDRLAAFDRQRPYKDYNGWFRTVLRPWVEGTLLDRRALDRGYFRPGYVRELVAAHMGGANHAVRLGALLGVELWHRQFVD